MTHRALFLDRDGVINVDHAYVYRPDQFEFIEGIFDLCRHARTLGYEIVVVTNQAGIGRGYYSAQDFDKLTHWMNARFAEHGITIAGVYYCPCHPEHGIGAYKRESDRRKPNPGMLLDAARDLGINLSLSILIGDKASDIEAGRRAGLKKSLLFAMNAAPGDAGVIRSLAEAHALLD